MPSTKIASLTPAERAELIASIGAAKADAFAKVPADVVAAAAKALQRRPAKAPAKEKKAPPPKVSKEDADATFAVIVIPNGARRTMEICAKLEKRFRLVGLHHHREAPRDGVGAADARPLGALRLMVGPEAPASPARSTATTSSPSRSSAPPPPRGSTLRRASSRRSRRRRRRCRRRPRRRPMTPPGTRITRRSASCAATCARRPASARARALLRSHGVEKLEAELTAAGVVAGGALTTGTKPFNVFARLASGAMTQPEMAAANALLDGPAAARFLLACNRKENDEHWADGGEWQGKASMSARHRFLLLKDLSWRWFNCLTFGIGGGAALAEAVATLEAMRDAALAYTRAEGGWSTSVGLYLHCYPFNSVQALHLHIVDLGATGPTFDALAHKNLPLDDVLHVLRAELVAAAPLVKLSFAPGGKLTIKRAAPAAPLAAAPAAGVPPPYAAPALWAATTFVPWSGGAPVGAYAFVGKA